MNASLVTVVASTGHEHIGTVQKGTNCLFCAHHVNFRLEEYCENVLIELKRIEIHIPHQSP